MFRKTIMLFVAAVFFMVAYLVSMNVIYVFLSVFMAVSGGVLILVDIGYKNKMSEKIDNEDEDEEELF